MIKRYRIMGKVQGVGYRAFVIRQARNLEVNGWVRNLGDGTVEALVDGPAARHAALENILREGPRFADVQMVLVVEEPDQSALAEGFTVSHERA